MTTTVCMLQIWCSLLTNSGANMNRPQPKATWMQRMSSDSIVEVDTFENLKEVAKVVGILLIVALAVIAAALGGPVGW